MTRRVKVEIEGTVQGVGFRPTVYRYARRHSLNGLVQNHTGGVVIDVEGADASIQAFLSELERQPPAQASIENMRVKDLVPCNYAGFEIEPSAEDGPKQLSIPPDLALCGDCRAEFFDSDNRRYRYPFINCTNCGPRYSIIYDPPYDRPRTSMANFSMCGTCRSEYTDPMDRRFDAQPNACFECGPALALLDSEGNALDGDPMKRTVELLRGGKIGIVKGLGGYHLCCLATDEEVVGRLRARKKRPHKAFAVMFATVDEVNEHCVLSEHAEAELTSATAPIVILPRRAHSTMADNVSPDTADIGAFLSYTPLHALLLQELSPLIMTSANLTDEPIAKERVEAGALLSSVGDFLLDHDRPIVRRCDDSVMRISPKNRIVMRRSRGLVPQALKLPFSGPVVLACGGDLKNTFALAHADRIILSPYIGDLSEYQTYAAFTDTVRDFKRIFQQQPEVIAYDLHPDYVSTRYAEENQNGMTGVRVQHHHAHIASCMAEHGLTGDVIGVALDGTGYGPDHTLWGGEFLHADYRDFERVAHLSPYPLPGGEAAVQNPLRMAFSVLVTDFGEEAAYRMFGSRLSKQETDTLSRMIAQGLNTFSTSSAGRIFDAVSALLGLCDGEVTYEGQAAVRLEQSAWRDDTADSYRFELVRAHDRVLLSLKDMFSGVCRDMERGLECGRIAAMVHNTLAEAVTEVCVQIRGRSDTDRVVLSGGVFQNALLLEKVQTRLQERGLRVYAHRVVPPNDGGISLGQAAIAAARWYADSNGRKEER